MAFRVVGRTIISQILELPVVDHCNLSCRACDHLSPVAPRREAAREQVEHDLGILARCFHANTIRLLGGEPLLHTRILEIAAVVRASGVADRICLVTNGVLLPRAPRELWGAIDRLEISIYPGHEIDPQSMAELRGKLVSAGVELAANRIGGFRESYSALGSADEDLIRRVYSACQIAHRWGCYSVYAGYFYKCPLAHYIPEYAGIVRRWGAHEDGVRLDGAADLFERLTAYLLDPDPLQACAYCLGSAGKLRPHEVLARSEWRSPQEKPLPELLDWAFLKQLEEVDPDAEWGCVENPVSPGDSRAATAPGSGIWSWWIGYWNRLRGRAHGSIGAHPNPIPIAGAWRLGVTTLSWTSRFTDAVEVRVGSPDGPLLSRTAPCGEATTGNWVCNGMKFYLQNVSGGLPLSAEGTLDVVEVSVSSGDDSSAVQSGYYPGSSLGVAILGRLKEFLFGKGSSPGVGQVRFGNLRRLAPIGDPSGLERGLPIDKFYIEGFLRDCAQDIQGVVLEVGDRPFTRRFGSDRIARRHVLTFEECPSATIVADLADAGHLPSEFYDCILAIDSLQYNYDVRAALGTLHRILRPGGVLLATLPGISRTGDNAPGSVRCWSFTPASARRLFTEFFPEAALQDRSYGNVLAAAAFLYGLSASELSRRELEYRDPGYSVTLAVRAVKPAAEGQARARPWRS